MRHTHITVMLLKYVLFFQAIVLGISVATDGSDADSPNDLVMKHYFANTLEFNHIGNFRSEETVIDGAFGYEEYELPCTSDMTSAFGYALGQCSRGATSQSYVYNWCALSNDQTKIYFHVTEYNGINCTESAKYNNTFWDYNTCDAVNSRKPFCTSSKQAWTNYEFDQHIESFNDLACQGEMNYWKADNTECLDFCRVSNTFTETIRGHCDANPNDWDDDVCFHVDSVIDYKGNKYTYEDLKQGQEPECSVPHSPTSRGVVISTSCGLVARVTDTHLMVTPQGFKQAYSLKPDDVLYGGYDNDMVCVVSSVEKELKEQEYFGLNCVHSEVLVSGLRASTFGDFHTLPSWYMAYVGGFLGPSAASHIGQYISNWFYNVHV